MDTTAGISLRPAASLLCVLNGGQPQIVARANGYRDLRPTRGTSPAPDGKRRPFSALLGAWRKTPPAAAPFPFDGAEPLLRDLLVSTPPEAPHRVCIAVPAWASETQRQQLARSAQAAGWQVLALLNEPVAAAMASGLGRGGVAFVYELAGDYCEVTVVAFRDDRVEILASDGLAQMNTRLGLPDYLARTEAPCERALAHAGLAARDVDAIVLVGEKTRETQTVSFVTTYFGKRPVTYGDPEAPIAVGAALHANRMAARRA